MCRIFEHTFEYNYELGRLEILDAMGNILETREVTYEEASRIMADLARVDKEIDMLEDTYGY